jgi:hypothetical protein
MMLAQGRAAVGRELAWDGSLKDRFAASGAGRPSEPSWRMLTSFQRQVLLSALGRVPRIGWDSIDYFTK